MSSLPDSDKVMKLRGLIRKHRTLSKELSEAHAVAAKIENLSEETRSVHREVLRVLESMDCKSSGNFGWEQRLMWMLTELVVQEETDARAN